jgi:hypothetical protein
MRVDLAHTVVVIPLPVVPRPPSAWARWRARVRLVVSHESFAEAVLVLVTLGLGVVLLAALDQAITLPPLTVVP